MSAGEAMSETQMAPRDVRELVGHLALTGILTATFTGPWLFEYYKLRTRTGHRWRFRQLSLSNLFAVTTGVAAFLVPWQIPGLTDHFGPVGTAGCSLILSQVGLFSVADIFPRVSRLLRRPKED
jgi:hypothetical protein